MKRAEELAIIKKFAPIVGLHTFTITIERGLVEDAVARGDCDFTEKTINIVKGDEYYDLTEEAKRATIIHELIECRILWMRQKVEDKTKSIIYEEQEELVNELTKALETIK